MLTITLEKFPGLTWQLDIQFIRDKLPESLLASALELDPTATTLLLTNEVVTPAVMTLLVNLSGEQEPSQHCSELAAAAGYLGVLHLLAFADPLYDAIPNRQYGNSGQNMEIIERIIKEDNVCLFKYLVSKRYIPTRPTLRQAAREGALKIVKYLIPFVTHMQHHQLDDVFLEACCGGQLEIVNLLLTYPIEKISPGPIPFYSVFGQAVVANRMEVAKYLRQHPRFRNDLFHHYIGRCVRIKHMHRLVRESMIDFKDSSQEREVWGCLVSQRKYEHAEFQAFLDDPVVTSQLPPKTLQVYKEVLNEGTGGPVATH